MKLIIDIPQDLYEHAKNMTEDSMDEYKAIRSIANGIPLLQCKDCKHFEYDSWARLDRIPLIVAHEICNRWGDGCKSSENGYCFLFEKGGNDEVSD